MMHLRCLAGRTASSTLHDVNALLIAYGTLGVGIGAVLDPMGQQLADRSRAAEERRRIERADRRAAEAKKPETADLTEPTDLPETLELADVVEQSVLEPAPTPALEPEVIRHLLPEGHSVPRTVGAAFVTGALFALAASHFGSHLILAPFLVFLAMAVVVSVTDLSHRLVPRTIIYGAMALVVPLLVVVSAVDDTWGSLVGSAIAAAAAFGVFFAIWFFVPRGMGFGDVRLAGAIGCTVGYLSLLHAYVAFLSGFVLGLLLGLVLMIGSSAGRKTRIPFAPALCAGAVVAIVWGAPLVDHIFHANG